MHWNALAWQEVSGAVADLAGKCHPYSAYDTDRMRLCRGYLNAHVAPLLKKALADAET